VADVWLQCWELQKWKAKKCQENGYLWIIVHFRRSRPMVNGCEWMWIELNQRCGTESHKTA
jgi:hypothetical protein